MPKFQPSKFQQAVFHFIEHGEGSAIVEAVAGSGKTTTILQALELIPSDSSVLFLAFNRDIADELRQRVPKGVEASTFHSLGMRAWGAVCPGRPRVEGNRNRQVLRNHMPKALQERYLAPVLKLVGWAKAWGLVPDSVKDSAPAALGFCSEQVWADLVSHFGFESDDEDFELGVAIEYAERLLAYAVNYGAEEMDFDDMLYLPVVCAAPLRKADFVFVDEAQDVSPIQLAMLRKLVRPDGGRLIAVGDPHQAIYGFRGADANSLPNIAQAFSAKRLPLSISYRCAKAIVAEAQEVVGHIESHEASPEGEVVRLHSWKGEDLPRDGAVLCRMNAPLISLAFALIRRGIGCHMLGRDIGKGLVSLIDRMQGKGIDGLQRKLDAWKAREIEKAQAKGEDAKVGAIEDRVACIEAAIANLPVNERTVPELKRRIEALFHSKDGVVTLSTVHKSKGMEWDEVWLLDRGLSMPSPFARQAWEQEQEANLEYVAITRAKAKLVDVMADDLVGA